MTGNPELTVSMPAFNSAAHVRAAIESVLSQQDVSFELIVVDDGSEDGTADIVSGIHDPRLRLIRNSVRKGIGYCHNAVLAQSRAPFIVHFDSDDLLIRCRAFRKLLDRIKGDEDLGLVHAHFIFVDRHGRPSRQKCRDTLAYQRATRKPGRDYRTALLREGSVMNYPRLLRKSVFAKIGPLNETLHFGIDYEMALRVAEHFRIDVVPEVLCAVRIHENNTTNLRWPDLRFWWQRVIIVGRLSRSGKITYARNRLLLAGRGFLEVLQVPRLLEFVLAVPRRAAASFQGWVRRLAESAYKRLLRHLGWWPLRPWTFLRRGRKTPPGIRAYYLWRFPTATFIGREIRALAGRGVPLVVIADEIDAGSQEARELSAAGIQTISLSGPMGGDIRHYVSRARKRHPIHYLHLCLYVIFHRYGFYKDFQEDRSLIRRVVVLSCFFADKGISHVHTPWADRTSFVAMAAAELAGITCSVQARAHDLHRRHQAFALREKFNAAAFIITNSEYNRRFISSMLREREQKKIFVMYEGVQPEQFKPETLSLDIRTPIRLLCVARLIEEKGLTVLLAACDELRRRSLDIQCEIIGGPERPAYAAYEVELRKQHRQLGLENIVKFSGSQPFSQVLRRYRAADIFVLPCVTAGNGGRDITPNALIEAMACGLPVVSTVTGGIPEIVENETDGLLVPPGDPQAIADAISRIAGDAGLRELLAENARSKVANKFNLPRNIEVLAEQLSR